MPGLTFSSKSNWGPYIISIAKTTSKKIGALNCSMNFLSPEVALYLYKSTIYPCTEYSCHVWACHVWVMSAPSCYTSCYWAGAPSCPYCYSSYKIEYAGLLVLHLLLLWNPWLIIETWPA